MQFLDAIGFTRYEGQCPFHDNRCLYRVIATSPAAIYGFGYSREVDSIHDRFKEFAGKIGELFRLRQQQDRILRDIGIELPEMPLFGPPVEIEIREEEVPLWAHEVKIARLHELERQRGTIQEEIDELSGYLPLLYGTGDMLVEAVIRGLRLLGLDAERTEPGFTADILAQTPDGLRKFGFEVTGISGAVKKDSRKLTQVLDFGRIKEHEEKTVLIVNTHNSTPISERTHLEDFTPQVLNFLAPFPILLMTSWDLYRMVCDVLEGSRTKEALVAILYETSGRLDYDS